MRSLLLASLLVIAHGPLMAATTRLSDEATGLETWVSQGEGMSVRLTQISPDQAIAFFIGRGFPAEAARLYAQACVFMTVIRNSGAQPLRYDLHAWRFVPEKGTPQRMRTKEQWLAALQRLGLSERARIGFAWSQVPTTQEFDPGDWIQGMTTYDLPRGARFDLRFAWTVEGHAHSATLEGARCARDDAPR